MVNEVDVNGDGVIDFEDEFLPMMAKKIVDIDDEEDLCDTLREFDRDDSGHINAVELRHLMTTVGEKLSEEQVDMMLKESNMDNQGKIDYRELVKLMLKNHSD